MDTIFEPEVIKRIQTDELEQIESLTLEQLQARIDEFQRLSRELYLRMQKSSAKLHERLSSVDDDELNAMIQKVPMASIEANARRLKNSSTKKKSAAEVMQAKVEKLSRNNPMVAEFLAGLKKK